LISPAISSHADLFSAGAGGGSGNRKGGGNAGGAMFAKCSQFTSKGLDFSLNLKYNQHKMLET